ncbi:hypothetical protein [Gillisia sp. JM1]|uniref:hypothetical protein n=1 Tax=Gillisia sp. JM1 TaxID=1283286 RepID=UPI00040EDDF5|nr:hypothetical protein [Gillisia sp. JM1]
MKFIKILFIVSTGILFHSCSVEDDLPTSGENSFFARLNGEKYIPKNIHRFPSGTQYGLKARKRDGAWYIDVDNRTDKSIYILIDDVEQPGNYLIQNVDLEYPNQIPRVRPTSVIIGNPGLIFYLTKEEVSPQFIKITEVQDSLIIGEFQKITLTDPENPNKKTFLTEGRFNINLTTLNKD